MASIRKRSVFYENTITLYEIDIFKTIMDLLRICTVRLIQYTKRESTKSSKCIFLITLEMITGIYGVFVGKSECRDFRIAGFIYMSAFSV